MRLAYFSPLNPAPSGIGDYSEELLPHLARFAAITLVVDGYPPSNRRIVEQFPIIDDRAYRASDFDLALYHLGNSPAHASIYRRALQEPGVIVLHDLVLHHLVAWLTLEHGDAAGYIAAMRDAYGDTGARLAEREASGAEALDRFQFPLSERVARGARGVIAHSRYAADAVRRMAPRVPVAQIPHEIPATAVLEQSAARAALGLDPKARLIGSFGNLGPAKRTPVLLDALRALRARLPGVQLLLVGAVSPNFDVRGLIELFDLGGAVRVLGHVPFDTFQTYMAAVDVCVNLRYPTAGETSGAVLRMMAQSKPVMVSRVGWFAELPDDAVVKIEVDEHEGELLTRTLERLLRDAPLRAAMGANARRYVLRECNVEFAAQSYADFLHAVLDGRAQSQVYSAAARTGAEFGQGNEPAKPGTESSRAFEPFGGDSNAREHPAQAQEPAQPAPEGGLGAADWRDEVARAYVSLGLDDTALSEVARAIVELGLDD